jgi:hypothetical protein
MLVRISEASTGAADPVSRGTGTGPGQGSGMSRGAGTPGEVHRAVPMQSPGDCGVAT